MKAYISIILLMMLNNAFGQKALITKICEDNYSKDSIINDTSYVLFGKGDPLLNEASCSWTCNMFIRFPNKINDALDLSDSLTDYNTNSICFINSPIKKKIDYQVYLERYTLIDTLTSEDSVEAYLRGFLIANGNRSSKNRYFEYSRIKKIKIVVNGKFIGIALLKDTPKIQYVDLGKSFLLSMDKKINFEIEIEEIYPGVKYTTLAISELQLDGFGGHSLTEKFCWK